MHALYMHTCMLSTVPQLKAPPPRKLKSCMSVVYQAGWWPWRCHSQCSWHFGCHKCPEMGSKWKLSCQVTRSESHTTRNTTGGIENRTTTRAMLASSCTAGSWEVIIFGFSRMRHQSVLAQESNSSPCLHTSIW